VHPFLGHVPLYFLMWLCAATVVVVLGAGMAASAGVSVVRTTVALLVLAGIILCGSKLLYLAEARFFPFDDYAPLEVRGALHGFRIPGGILLLAAAMPLVCRVFGLPWREFGDRMIPLAAVALVFIRLGCFLNGCCFGRVSSMPWAVAFPRQSWVYWYHRAQGWVPRGASASLLVHPLQLYFLLAAAVTAGVVVWLQRRAAFAGQVQLVFYALFFASTALLEPLRQNSLTLNSWLCPIAAVAFAGVLAGRILGPGASLVTTTKATP
jgi:phosphatidylglycerol:prolipoprotein diacylglycerol transferase